MLFHSGCGYYPHFMDISALRGNIHVPWILPHFVEISTIRGYYPYFVDISVFCGYYPRFVDIIHIGHITSYLARNVRNILHSFFLVVDIIFGRITSYLACNICPISHIYSSSESDWCIGKMYLASLRNNIGSKTPRLFIEIISNKST